MIRAVGHLPAWTGFVDVARLRQCISSPGESPGTTLSAPRLTALGRCDGKSGSQIQDLAAFRIPLIRSATKAWPSFAACSSVSNVLRHRCASGTSSGTFRLKSRHPSSLDVASEIGREDACDRELARAICVDASTVSRWFSEGEMLREARGLHARAELRSSVLQDRSVSSPCRHLFRHELTFRSGDPPRVQDWTLAMRRRVGCGGIVAKHHAIAGGDYKVGPVGDAGHRCAVRFAAAWPSSVGSR
jgi:hypothetical protein